jgi:hypothetical protein
MMREAGFTALRAKDEIRSFQGLMAATSTPTCFRYSRFRYCTHDTYSDPFAFGLIQVIVVASESPGEDPPLPWCNHIALR